MKTKEDVIKHLSEVGYTWLAQNQILGYLVAKDIVKVDETVTFKSGENLGCDFYEWFNEVPKEGIKEAEKDLEVLSKRIIIESEQELYDPLFNHVKEIYVSKWEDGMLVKDKTIYTKSKFHIGQKVTIKKEIEGLVYEVASIIPPKDNQHACKYELHRTSTKEGTKVIQYIKEHKLEAYIEQSYEFKKGDWVRDTVTDTVFQVDGRGVSIPTLLDGTFYTILYDKTPLNYDASKCIPYEPKVGECFCVDGNYDGEYCILENYKAFFKDGELEYVAYDERHKDGWCTKAHTLRPATKKEEEVLITEIEQEYHKTYNKETKKWEEIKKEFCNPIDYGIKNFAKEVKRVANVRSYNVGNSDYSKYKIQPWDIWEEYNLNPWDADIVKRVLRDKQGEERTLDYQKIIHICKERIRQLENETKSPRQ